MPPPPLSDPSKEQTYRRSAQDRLTPPIEDGPTGNVVYRQRSPAPIHRSISGRTRSHRGAGSVSAASSYSTGRYEHSHGLSNYETIQLLDDGNRGIIEYPIGLYEAQTDGWKEKEPGYRYENPERDPAERQTKATSGQKGKGPQEHPESIKGSLAK